MLKVATECILVLNYAHLDPCSVFSETGMQREEQGYKDAFGRPVTSSPSTKSTVLHFHCSSSNCVHFIAINEEHSAAFPRSCSYCVHYLHRLVCLCCWCLLWFHCLLLVAFGEVSSFVCWAAVPVLYLCCSLVWLCWLQLMPSAEIV